MGDFSERWKAGRAPRAVAICWALVVVSGCGDDGGESHFEQRLGDQPTTRHVGSDPTVGPALGVADLDGDGILDLLVGGGVTPMEVWLGRGDLTFEKAPSALGLEGLVASAVGVGDLDADGSPELVTASPEGIRLFRRRDGSYVDESAAAGLEGLAIVQPSHVLLADLDRDGLSDIHVSSYGGVNRVLRARGDGAFEDRAAEWGMDHERFTWSATFADLDDDGDPDLYLTTDTFETDPGALPEGRPGEGMGDLFFRNEGWADGMPAYTEVASEVGLDTQRSSMAALATDLNGDGRLDLLITDFGRNHAVVAEGDRWVHQGAELGLDDFVRDDISMCPEATVDFGSDRCLLVSWGAYHEDLDADGSDELLIVNGGFASDDERVRQPPSLFEREDGRFSSVPSALPVMEARASALADLDGDGDADLVVTERAEPPRVFENLAPESEWARLVSVDPRGSGATVRFLRDGEPVAVRALGAAGRHQTHLPPVSRHLFETGLEAEIRWPTGARETVAMSAGEVEVAPAPAVEVSSRVAATGGEPIAIMVTAPASASVEVLADGESLPLTPDEAERWRAELTSPESPNRLTLQVRVDGAPIAPRPRLIFE